MELAMSQLNSHAAVSFRQSHRSSCFRKQSENNGLRTGNHGPAFDIEEVSLSSSKLLGIGTFGSVYTAVMDNGVTIAVKKLHSVIISELEFKRQMDIIGNVRHKNVAPLRAYYSSTDEKLLLYDYHSTHSMHALLHGKTDENVPRIDWETRIGMAIGAARGIAEIHSHNGGKLVHGNIKSSNIFLNSQHYGCVSDLGLANIIETTFMPTAHYYAPEVKTTQNVSQESDVYSFGILLLELLTGKSPIHVNLIKLVNSIKSKVRISTVFDAYLLSDPTIREQMVKMLQIGISCIAKSLKKRPKMAEVVNMLKNLDRINTGSSVSSERKLVFVDDGNALFDLEELMRASAEVLGKGTFGTSYKSRLQNGDGYRVVNRLKHVSATFEEFQQHMEVIGSMRHENVNGLMAYYFSKDEVLLVYDYLDQRSVSALLHAKVGGNKTKLHWETRLQIAIGAARGISHIHGQDGKKFVHGNIKASNIFLNKQRYGLISDTGVAKVARRVKRSAMPTPGYLAPELKSTKEVSQASDVYSFGVVLLELITGKPSQHTEDGALDEWVRSVSRDYWLDEVFDAQLMEYRNDREAMDQILQIGLDCVNFVPENRPMISEVVKMLEEISGIDMRGLPSVESRLEDLLEDLLPMMTL